MTITDIIKKRYSERNYEYQKLTESDKKFVEELIKDTGTGPFGNKARFILIEKPEVIENQKLKLGTYGFISNARYFIAGAIEKNEFFEFDFGYLMEKIILELTAKDLGTCWIGGTFKRKEYNELLNVSKNEIVPGITPVGYPASKKNIFQKMGFTISSKGKRMDFNKLFFEENFDSPLIYDQNNEYMQALEMVRLAPSAVNRQPWRVIRVNDMYHFYLAPNRSLSVTKTVNLQKIDMGIALSHFYLTLKSFNKSGQWKMNNPQISDLEYVISWVAK